MPKKKVKKKSTKKRRDVEGAGMRMEMELMRAEESAQKEEERRKRILLEKCQTEEAMTASNLKKVQEHWRMIMRAAKLEELKKSVGKVAEQHEHDVDRKDAQILMARKSVEEANAQYEMAVRSFGVRVEQIVQLFNRAAAQLDHEFNSEVKELREDFEREKAQISDQHSKDTQELLDIITAMEQEFDDAEAEARQEFQAQRDDIKNKNTDEYLTLKETLMNAIVDLERHFDDAHDFYLQHTREDTETFKISTVNDAYAAKTIETQMAKLERLQGELNHWRIKHANNVKECEERNKALQDEKNAVSQHFQALKSKMNRMRQRQQDRLLQLTKKSDECVKALDRKLKRAERILHTSEMCRKLESEREKVLPFYPSTETEEAPSEMQQQVASDMRTFRARAVDMSNQKVEDQNYLDNFYRRFNKVLLDQMILERHRATLKAENDEMRAILKQYLDGISISEEVLAQENTLMIVNGRTNAPLGRMKSKQPPSQVDGRSGRPVYNVVEATTVINTPNRVPQ